MYCRPGTLTFHVPQYQVACKLLLPDIVPYTHFIQQVEKMMMPMDGIPSLLAVAAGSGSMGAFRDVRDSVRQKLPDKVRFRMLQNVNHPGSTKFPPQTSSPPLSHPIPR